jgi:hypothetical protein
MSKRPTSVESVKVILLTSGLHVSSPPISFELPVKTLRTLLECLHVPPPLQAPAPNRVSDPRGGSFNLMPATGLRRADEYVGRSRTHCRQKYQPADLRDAIHLFAL